MAVCALAHMAHFAVWADGQSAPDQVHLCRATKLRRYAGGRLPQPHSAFTQAAMCAYVRNRTDARLDSPYREYGIGRIQRDGYFASQAQIDKVAEVAKGVRGLREVQNKTSVEPS